MILGGKDMANKLNLTTPDDESYDICPRCQKELEKWWDEVRGESEK